MDYVNLSTAKFYVGDRIKYIDPTNPATQHLVEISKVSDETDTTTTVLLDVFVVNSTDESVLPGDTFTLTIDRAGSVILGIIIRKGTPLAAHDDFMSRSDLVIYYLVAMLNNKKLNKPQATYRQIYQYMSGLGILGDAAYEESLKEIILPAIKSRRDLFRLLTGGHVRYTGGALTPSRRSRGVNGNSINTTKVVDVSLIVQGFSAFLVGVLKSGILGNVEIKYE